MNPIPERRHRWGDSVSIPFDTPSGCEETERLCLACGMVRISVLPPRGNPWRAWRTRDGVRTDVPEHMPPCNPVGVVEAVA